MNEKDNLRSQKDESVDFNFQDFLRLCLKKWYWFVICMSFAVGIALFYLYSKQPEYKRYEQILVTEQDSGGGVGDVASAFSTLGLFSKNSNVYNELLTITSPAILYQVVDTLHLYMNYSQRDGLRYKNLYGTNQPFIVTMPDIDRQQGAGFRMHVQPDGSMKFDKFVKIVPGGKVKYNDEIEIKVGTTEFNSPLGRISVKPNPVYVAETDDIEKVIKVNKMAMQTAVELYGLKLSGDLADDDADVIELTIEDVSVERAVDILESVLDVYNQNWIDDKNRMAIATSIFIEDRLKVIEAELNQVDQTIAEYLKKNGTPDLVESVKANMEIGARMEQEMIEVYNQLSMARYMKEFLENHENLNTILPVNLGIDSPDLAAQIVLYNDMLMTRNNILNNSSSINPMVQNYDRELSQMRIAIDKAITNQINVLQATLNNLRIEVDKKSKDLSVTPEKQLPLLSEERQQQIKQELYLFLLQKKEENELTQKFSADNVRVITPPIGPLDPVSPRKALIIVIALIIGFGAPLLILYYLDSIDNTIKSKEDLSMLTMAFAGEIPQVGKKVKLKDLKEKIPGKKVKDEKPPLAVVEEGKRDVVNEAFRVIRGNIDFMSGKNAGHQVIMLTSFNPGSGKSFISYNLAMSFALKNRKVLIIDCDLRHGSSSMYLGSPSKGLTAYLTGGDDNWKGLVRQTENPNLSILPIGKMPPNPAELLEDPRMAELVEAAKKEYDIVFLDCPPVNIVVDTQIVAPLADRTLFVVRAGLLQRGALKELNEFYEEKKFNNISVILNGTEAVKSRYYTYGNYQHLN